jgi:hypothetical protein
MSHLGGELSPLHVNNHDVMVTEMKIMNHFVMYWSQAIQQIYCWVISSSHLKSSKIGFGLTGARTGCLRYGACTSLCMTEHHLKVGYNSQLLGLNYESLTTRRIIILCFSLRHSKLGFVKQMKWALLEKIELVTQSIEVGFTVCNIFKWGLCAGKVLCLFRWPACWNYRCHTFAGLLKLVQDSVLMEMKQRPTGPIYLVGDSFGGALALSVAARNPTLDLVLILANPGQ